MNRTKAVSCVLLSFVLLALVVVPISGQEIYSGYVINQSGHLARRTFVYWEPTSFKEYIKEPNAINIILNGTIWVSNYAYFYAMNAESFSYFRNHPGSTPPNPIVSFTSFYGKRSFSLPISLTEKYAFVIVNGGGGTIDWVLQVSLTYTVPAPAPPTGVQEYGFLWGLLIGAGIIIIIILAWKQPWRRKPPQPIPTPPV